SRLRCTPPLHVGDAKAVKSPASIAAVGTYARLSVGLTRVFVPWYPAKKNSNASPRNWLVPDLVTALTAAPECMPFCAVRALVSARNSCSASGNGSGRFRLSYGLLCVAPSRLYATPKASPPPTEKALPPCAPPMLLLVALFNGCGTTAGRN